MTDFKIRRGLSTDLFENGVVKENVVLEEGCWYLCTDTVELYVCVETEAGRLDLSRVNDGKASNRPTQSPDDEEQVVEVLGAYVREDGDIYLVFSDGSEKSINSLVDEVVGDVATKADVAEAISKVKIPDSTFADIYRKTERVRYEVLTEDGLVVDYSDKEIRLNTSSVTPRKQNTSEAAEDDGFYIGLRAYAPDNAVTFKEDLKSSPGIDDDTIFEFVNNGYAGVDSLGRKYSVVWLKAAALNEDGTWKKYGDDSTADKSLGYYYTVEWRDAYDKIIDSDCIRVVFTNDSTHYTTIDDAVIRKINDKLASIPTQDLSDYALKSEIPDDYITEKDLDGKGFITDVSDKADKDHNHSISEIEGYEAPDLSKYAKTEDLDAYATTEALEAYAKVSDIPDVNDFINAIPDDYITASKLEGKDYITQQALEEYAKLSDVPSIEGLAATNDVVSYVTKSIEGINIPEPNLTDYATDVELEDAVETLMIDKADNYLFKNSNAVVTEPIGGFSLGDNIKTFSVAQILAKLLGLSFSESEHIYTPDVPSSLQAIIERITDQELSVYQIKIDELTEVGLAKAVSVQPVEYKYDDSYESHKTVGSVTGFYQVKSNSVIVESGYEHYTDEQSNMYYMIALPKELILGENVVVKSWSGAVWNSVETSSFTSGAAAIQAALAKDGVTLDYSNLPEDYTLWAILDTNNPGMKYRFIIKQVREG